MGLIEARLLHEGRGSWPLMLNVVGPPSSRRIPVARVRNQTLSGLHGTLGLSRPFATSHALASYGVRHGLRHLLSIPDHDAAYSALLDPIVHQVAETDSGIQQVRGAWAALGVQGPAQQWQASIAEQLPESGSDRVAVLRGAARFALAMGWADAALWSTQLILEAEPIDDADRLLRVRALTASADVEGALALLDALAMPKAGPAMVRRLDMRADLLIRLQRFESALGVLDRHPQVDPAQATSDDFLRDVSRGQCALGLGKHAEAWALALRASDGLQGLFGGQNPQLLRVIDLQVQVHQAQGNAGAAKQALLDMLVLAEAIYGSGHGVPLTIQQRLSALEEDEAGIARLRGALVAGGRRLGDSDPGLFPVRLALADRLWDAEQSRNSVVVLQMSLRWIDKGSPRHEEVLTRLVTRTMSSDPAMAVVWAWRLLTLRPKPTAASSSLCQQALGAAGRPGWRDHLRLKAGEIVPQLSAVVRLAPPDGPLRAAVNRLQKTRGRRHPETIGIRLLQWRDAPQKSGKEELWQDVCHTFGLHHPATVQLAAELGFTIPESPHPWLQNSLPWF